MAPINGQFWDRIRQNANNALGWARGAANKLRDKFNTWADLASDRKDSATFTNNNRSTPHGSGSAPSSENYMLDADGYKINSSGQRVSPKPVASPLSGGSSSTGANQTKGFWSKTQQFFKNFFNGNKTNTAGKKAASSSGIGNWFRKFFNGGGAGGGAGGGNGAGKAGKGFFSRIFGKGSMAVGWFGAAITVAFGVFDGIQEANYNANKEGYKFWQRPGKWLGDFFNRAGRSLVVGFGSLLAGAAAAAAIGTGGLAFAVGLGISALVGWGLNKWINNDWPTNTREQMNIDSAKEKRLQEARENSKKLVDENKMLIHMDPNDILNSENFDKVEKFLDASVYRVNSGNFVPVFDDRSRPSPFASVNFSDF